MCLAVGIFSTPETETMSHHFDTPTAKEDPRINVCDFYLFAGAPGTTVMAMSVNPDAGLSAPETFREDALYAFRFDLDGDAREEVAFKVRFDAVQHAEGDGRAHVQRFRVRAARGAEALWGEAGEELITGETGKPATRGGGPGVRAFAGIAPDLFAGDALALHTYLAAFYDQQRFDPDAFLHRQNYFAKRNVAVIVLEVPTPVIGAGKVHGWATASLFGHAPEVQVSRWGLPLVTNIFLSDPAKPDLKERFNRSLPSEDVANFSRPIAELAMKMSTYAGSASNPRAYGRQVGDLLCPTVLPYELGTEAVFGHAGFNGRALGDDVMDVMLTLTCNRPLGDGVAPDRSRIGGEFPYFGEPYSRTEQTGVTPVPRPAKR